MFLQHMNQLTTIVIGHDNDYPTVLKYCMDSIVKTQKDVHFMHFLSQEDSKRDDFDIYDRHAYSVSPETNMVELIEMITMTWNWRRATHGHQVVIIDYEIMKREQKNMRLSTYDMYVLLENMRNTTGCTIVVFEKGNRIKPEGYVQLGSLDMYPMTEVYICDRTDDELTVTCKKLHGTLVELALESFDNINNLTETKGVDVA